MTRLTDCMVNYFGVSDERGLPTRYFCYHVVGGPGPTGAAGVAVISSLAASDRGGRCVACEGPHFVEAGGPEAAVAKALRHLDAFHEEDRLRKVQTPLRRFAKGAGTAAASEAARF